MKNIEEFEKMLIIVDMVNGFVKEGVLHDEDIAKIIPRQSELIRNYINEEELIVFIKDTHDENAIEFTRFGNSKHCVKGTREAELVDELKVFENYDNAISIEKNSTSFMESPDFRTMIQKLSRLKTTDVVGCCTDICDVNGTMGLANYMDQWNRDVAIRVHLDAVATYAEASRKNYVDAALLLMEQQGIQLVKKDK